MKSRLNPYLSFRDNARQAMEFYHTVFGGKLTLTTFGESGTPADQPGANNIMHGELESEAVYFMGSDVPADTEHSETSNISMSLTGDNDKELRGYFEKLLVGGTISQPLVEAPWGDTFGMLTDKFGTFWMVNIAGKKN